MRERIFTVNKKAIKAGQRKREHFSKTGAREIADLGQYGCGKTARLLQIDSWRVNRKRFE